MVGRKPIQQDANDTVVVGFDLLNEQSVLVAGLLDDGGRPALCRQVTTDSFCSDKHKRAWEVVTRLVEKGLTWDQHVLSVVCGDQDLAAYLVELVTSAGVRPHNTREHVKRLEWDASRMRAASGPLPQLLRSIKNTAAEPDVVRAAAKRVLECFDGAGDTTHMLAPGVTSGTQACEIRMRMAGKATYPFGIPGLDNEPDGTPLLVPGAAPGRNTVLTGVSGSGKSMLAAKFAHGLYRQRRKVLYGAWEPGVGNALEVVACMECGFSRRKFRIGACTDAEAKQHAEAMRDVEKYVRLLSSPFRQGSGEVEGQDGRKKWDTNERRIDVLARYIEQSGCEVFIGDLMKRAFARFRDAGEEEAALYLVQDMTQSLGIHLVALHQQLIKGEVERKPDKRPTREGLVGSSAWLGIADLVIGVHREFLFHNVEDNRIEIHILKQRDGRWPASLEFEYDGDHASLKFLRQFDYRALDGAGELGEGLDSKFREPKRGSLRPPKVPHLHAVEDDSPY